MATAIAWVQTALRLGPALGPVIGGTLAATVGLRETFVVASVCYLVALLLVIFGYHEARQPEQGHQEPLISFRELRRLPHFTLFLGIVFGLQLVDRSFGPILPLYLGEIGTAASKVPFLSGVIFTVAAAAAAMGNQVNGWFIARFGIRRVLTVASLVASVPALVFGFGPPTLVLAASAIVFGFAVGLATTTVYTAAGRDVDHAARGVVFGYLTTSYLAGLAVSPVIAGFIGSVSNRTVFFVDAASLCVVAAIIHRKMADP